MNKRSRVVLLGAGLLAAGWPVYADAQDLLGPTTMSFPSWPVLAAPGEVVLLCASNLGRGATFPPEPVTIEFTALAVSVVAEGSGNETTLGDAIITLPPLGSTIFPADPCLEAVIPSALPFAPSPNQLVTGVVRLNPQPLPPHGFVATMEVFTPAADGTPTNVRVVPFFPSEPCLASTPAL